MTIDITTFEVNKVYLGKNIDKSLFIFKVLNLYIDEETNQLTMRVKIMRDDDSTNQHYEVDSEQEVKHRSEPFDCFTYARLVRNKSEILAIVL